MKKQILEALKAKFAGVSEAILNRIADKLAKTVTTEEQVKTAIETVTFQQVLESYGDSRATEAQQTAISNYEKKHGLKDGQKVDDGSGEDVTKTPAAGGADVPDWAKQLIDSNKQLTERLNKMDGERTTATRRQKFNAVIEKLPEDYRKAYGRTPVENLSDEDFESLITEVGKEVEGINVKSAVFGRPFGNGGVTKSGATKEATEEEANAVVSKLNI